MMLPVKARLRGWLPLTPRNVSAFACAPLRRLLLVQFAFAVLIAGTVAWVLSADWLPSIRSAIRQLPAQGEIRSGRLSWTQNSPQVLSEGNFLSFTVDLNHQGGARGPSHIQVEFGRQNVWIRSFFGYAQCGYPQDWIIPFNRPELEPWWGAWEPPILWLTVGATIAGLMAGWTLLATMYWLPVWLIGFYMNRDLNLRGSWKIAGAALMPGALLMAAGTVWYGLGGLDPLKWLVVAAAHFLMGWLYLAIGLFLTPKLQSVSPRKGNPFAGL